LERCSSSDWIFYDFLGLKIFNESLLAQFILSVYQKFITAHSYARPESQRSTQLLTSRKEQLSRDSG
jgi:hypothetical protein